MALWHRINQSKLKLLSNQFKRYYSQNPYASSSLICTFKASRSCLLDPRWIAHDRPAHFWLNVRFFAAPVQAKAKKEEKSAGGPRLNGEITAQNVRLVSDEGHGVVSLYEALERARKLNLDLVEVQRNADPPVCRIMNYHKEKYIQELKEKERVKSKSQGSLRKGDCKEVRFFAKTEQKDLQMKADAIRRLLERGYRVKCMAMAPTKQKDDVKEDLGALLSRLTPLIEDVSVVESGPRVEKKQAYVIVRHVKFGQPKKGKAKKLTDVQNDATVLESGEETAEVDEDNKPSWSIADSTEDFNDTFHFNDDANGHGIKPVEAMKTMPEPVSTRANFSVPNFSHPLSSRDCKREDRLPSSPLEPSAGTENRYKRSESRNDFPQTSRDNRGLANRIRQAQPGMNVPPSMAPGRQVGSNSSTFGNFQFANQSRQAQPDVNVPRSMEQGKQVGANSSPRGDFKLPLNQMPNQDHSPPAAPSKVAHGYGAFSSPTVNGQRKQGVAEDVDRNTEGNRYGSARTPNAGGFGSNPNFPGSKSASTDGRGGWGVFSSDGPQTNRPNGASNSN